MSWQDIRLKLREAAQYVKRNKILDAGAKSLLSQIPVVGGVVAAFWDNVDIGQAEKATEVAKFLERLSNQEEAHFDTLVGYLEEQKQELTAGKQSLNGLLDDVARLMEMTERIEVTGDATHENSEEAIRMLRMLSVDIRRINKKIGISALSEALEVRASLTESDRRKIDENEKVYSAIRETGIPAVAADSYQMGLVAAFQRRYVDAEYHFKETLAADAEHGKADTGLALMYYLRHSEMERMGDLPSAERFLKQAEMHVNRALSLDPFDLEALIQSGYIYNDYARQYIRRQQPEKAVELLDKAKQHFEYVQERDPRNAGAYNGLGWIYYLRGDFDSAIDQHKKALLLRPDYASAHCDLGEVYFQKGHTDSLTRRQCYQKSLAEYKQALEQNEQQPSLDEGLVQQIQTWVAWQEKYLAQN